MQKEVITVITEYLGLSPGDLDRGLLLYEDLNLSPIEINDLVSHLSQKFNLSLRSEDLADVKTVDDLIILVEDNSI